MIGRTFLIQSLCAVAALFAWNGASAAPLKDPATALGLIPHKALYDVSLVSAKNGSQIVNIHGKMFFEWKPSCEGWITDHRFILSYDYADSSPMSISSDFSTFEAFDGKSMNFSSRRKKDGEVYEDIRGKAALDKPGGGGQAVYSIPEGLTFDLGPEVMFPTTQTSALLKRARQGTGLFKTVIFDGSDEEGPVEVNSFIGKKFEKVQDVARKRKAGFTPAAASGTIDETLLGPGWSIRMAFFPVKAIEAPSDYELTMAFHENGVISDMTIEYNDFSVRQKLVALERVKADSCKN